MSLHKLFLGSATVNVATAAFNLLGTVLMVRWFGASVYADYLVDLAYLSLVLILLEVVPSNYSLFRVQDEPSRIHGLAALAVASALVLGTVSAIAGYGFGLFHANSAWIAPYAALMGIKRYLDIRLQSTGRLRDYFGIELRSAAIRLALMGVFLWMAINPVDAVWASLACATLLTQFAWFADKPEERSVFHTVGKVASWSPLLNERHAYVPYYFGIALKRLRDNMVAILAGGFFLDKNALAAFFLAFRGLVFAMGQMRIIEGLLSHRATLAQVSQMQVHRKLLVAVLGQLLCIAASVTLVYLSGAAEINLHAISILSFSVLISTIFMVERAKQYSKYAPALVNYSMVCFCVLALILSCLGRYLSLRTVDVFSLIIVFSEGASLMLFLWLSGRNR